MEFKDIEPISVNEMYRPTVSAPDKNGKRHGFLRSSNELMSFQDKFDALLAHNKDKIDKFIEDSKSLYKYLGFKVTLLIGMPKDEFFYKRNPDDLRPHDVSNYPKAIEDRLAVITGVDDKYNTEMRLFKYCSNSDKWGFTLVLEPTDYMNYNENYYREVIDNEGN